MTTVFAETPLFTGIGSVSIPADVGEFQTSGYSTVGIGAASYRRTTNTGANNFRTASQDGAFWELSETKIDPVMFGAKADVHVFANATVAGSPGAYTQVTIPSYTLSTADTGKQFWIWDPNTDTMIKTTISSVTAPHVAIIANTLSAAVSTNTSGGFGSDDSAIIN